MTALPSRPTVLDIRSTIGRRWGPSGPCSQISRTFFYRAMTEVESRKKWGREWMSTRWSDWPFPPATASFPARRRWTAGRPQFRQCCTQAERVCRGSTTDPKCCPRKDCTPRRAADSWMWAKWRRNGRETPWRDNNTCFSVGAGTSESLDGIAWKDKRRANNEPTDNGFEFNSLQRKSLPFGGRRSPCRISILPAQLFARSGRRHSSRVPTPSTARPATTTVARRASCRRSPRTARLSSTRSSSRSSATPGPCDRRSGTRDIC